MELPIELGKTTNGVIKRVDLVGLVHLLIAGSTGSGKSVCINSIITNLINNVSATNLNLVLIDPKRVELNQYNNINHLYNNTIYTEIEETIQVLSDLCILMDRRYQMLKNEGVKNIQDFNKKRWAKRELGLKYIVIIIDEYADLVQNDTNKKVQYYIKRITQLARAAGIHLIVATQRPSADVINSVIKSNIPSKVCFRVQSAINSRIVIDNKGAEKLEKRGQMLFKSVESNELIELQGSYISDDAINNIVEKNQRIPEIINNIEKKSLLKTLVNKGFKLKIK